MQTRSAVDQEVARLRRLAAGPALADPGLRRDLIHELESLLARLRAADSAQRAEGGAAEPDEGEFWIAM